MSSYILNFKDIDKTKLPNVGGKGANLGELYRIGGLQVPEGFCITTNAYVEITQNNKELDSLLDQLSSIKSENRKYISEISARIRTLIEEITIPGKIRHEIVQHLEQLGADNAFAIRSSATAEDLPAASFAGQQDSYLNISGKDSILQHVRKCWASLFTDRAVVYRIQNSFDHRKVHLSVVVQQMIFPQASGILFTVDPVTSNRKVTSIDASFGLGEALVSGIVNADVYKIRNGEIIDKKISAKKLAIYASPEGGTKEQPIKPELQHRQTLTDEQILQLGQIGKMIEKHFDQPQDIEWCLANDKFYTVQSRPITTLFPIPEANDQENHIYISVGHQQMMTDAMRPLGLSLWQLTAARPMAKAGGRLFVDVAMILASPTGRENILNVLGQSDPLIKDALLTIIERGDFIRSMPAETKEPAMLKSSKGMSASDIQAQVGTDTSIVSQLMARNQASIEVLKQDIQSKSGTELLDFILNDLQQLRQSLVDPQSMAVIMAPMNAAAWINEKMKEWLGEKNPADTLSQSVSNNVTSEMGLALLDIADLIRPYPEIVKYLRQVKEDNFIEELVKFKGGKEIRDALLVYFDKYGMRCAGEIDITRARWSEKPSTLIPALLSNIRNLEPGAGKRKFDQGLKEALKKEKELLERLKQLPEGEQKASETKQMIDLIRNFSGYREYPKYGIVSRTFWYRQALLKEAERLLQAHVIHEPEDLYYLTFEELREVVRTQKLDPGMIRERKAQHKIYEKLHPPRVITSDGEIVSGTYKRENMPAGAILGLPVSSGIAEGRARVILHMEDAELEEGDILVTTFTDPSWTPLFVSIKGLITEVGGLMTHGAVIAREYGLPAIVGVDNATKLIKDGQRIRVNGIEGFVEIL